MQLTIDADVQRATEEGFRATRLQRRRGHPRSAQRAKCCRSPACRPTIPTSSPAASIARPGTRCITDKLKPLQNRALQGTLLARLDVQDCGRPRRRSRKGVITPDFRVLLPRRRELLRPLLPVPPEGRPRHRSTCGTRSSSRATSTSTRRQHARRRPHPQVGVAARARRAQRHRPAERGPGAGAVDRVEDDDSARRSGTPARRSRSRSARARSP